MDTRLIDAQDLVVRAGHGQIYVMADYPEYPEEWYDADDEQPPHEAALDEAWGTGRYVAVCRALLNVVTPGQRNPRTPMRLEVWSAGPTDDLADWDHEVDVDFDVPSGTLSIGEPTAVTRDQVVWADIPPGRYRVRVSGRGFTAVGAAGANGADEYRLRFWPRAGDTAPALRKRWPGWGPQPA
jgi:hypothetical protein